MAKRYTDYSIEGILNINNEYSFPIIDGLIDQVLRTDGFGNVTWQDASSGNAAYTETKTFVAGVPQTTTHSLGTDNIQVQLIDLAAGGVLVQGDITNYTANTVDVEVSSPVANLKIVVLADGGSGGSGGCTNAWSTFTTDIGGPVSAIGCDILEFTSTDGSVIITGIDGSPNKIIDFTGAGGGSSLWIEGGTGNTAMMDAHGTYTVTGVCDFSLIAGGNGHTLTGENNFIGGGLDGTLNATENSALIAGHDNTIEDSIDAIIMGGADHQILDTSTDSVINGGHEHLIEDALRSVIIAGDNSGIKNSSIDSTIIGGSNNEIGNITAVTGGVIIGGDLNELNDAVHSVIIGGANNDLDGFDKSVIIGGDSLTALADETVYVPNLNINSLPANPAVSTLGLDVDGNVVEADSSINNQLWIQTTFFNNLFSQGVPSYTYPHDYMEWTSNASGTDVMPVLIMPFACRLLSITFRWCSENGTTVTIGPGERFFVDIGTVTPGTGATPDNWTSKTGTVVGVGTTVLGEGIMELTNADSGTIPSISNSMANFSPAQDIVFAAGDEVAVIGFEVGNILPNDVDAQCCMVFELLESSP